MMFPRCFNCVQYSEDGAEEIDPSSYNLKDGARNYGASRKRSRNHCNTNEFLANHELQNIVNSESLKKYKDEDTVSESIRKGRKALSNAEQHIKMFEDYLVSSNNKNQILPKPNPPQSVSRELPFDKHLTIDSKDDDETNKKKNLPRASNKTDLKISQPKNTEDAPSIASLDQSFDYSDCNFEVKDFVKSIVSQNTEWDAESNAIHENQTKILSKSGEFQYKELEKLIKRREQRMLRDIRIFEAKTRDNNLNLGFRALTEINNTSEENASAHHTVVKVEREIERLKAFDPSKLYGAKRAALKAAKRAMCNALSEEEASKKTNFKARPLPGGIWVKNDPYALTQAALGKKTFRRSEDENDGDQNENMSPTKQIQMNVSQKKKKKRNKVYETLTDYFQKTTDLDSETASDIPDEGEDEEHSTVSLHQNISQLQAALNQKKMQCMKMIEYLDTDINEFDNGDDLDVILFDIQTLLKEKEVETLISTKESSKKGSRCWQEVGLSDDLENVNTQINFEKNKPPANQMPKRKSWSMIKAEHDKLEKETREKELALEEERRLKEKEMHDTNMNEVQRMQKVANEKKKKMKSGIDKKKQDRYTEKLCKPRCAKDAIITKKCDNNQNFICEDQASSVTSVETKKNVTEEQAEHKNSEEKLLSDMSDKEFAKLVKKLGISNSEKHKSRRKKKPFFNKRKIHFTKEKKIEDNDVANEGLFADIIQKNDFLSNDENDENKVSIDANICTDFEVVEGDGVEKRCSLNELSPNCEKQVNENGKSNVPSNKSFSVDAQTNIMRRLMRSENHERNVANARNAIHAVENELKLQDEKKEKKNENSHFDNIFFSQTNRHNNMTLKDEPYEKYEKGQVPFFDRSSSTEKGRFRVRDARDFVPGTMCRKKYSRDDDRIMLLVGKKENNDTAEELTITIMFDKNHFDEKTASEWWNENRKLFVAV